jgi:hypothetical protein
MRLFDVRKLLDRLAAGWFVVASLCFGFMQYSGSVEAANVTAPDSISPNCSAFKKESDGKWIATKRSEIRGSVSGPEAIYPGLNLDMMRPNGFDLVDALNKKCGG